MLALLLRRMLEDGWKCWHEVGMLAGGEHGTQDRNGSGANCPCWPKTPTLGFRPRHSALLSSADSMRDGAQATGTMHAGQLQRRVDLSSRDVRSNIAARELRMRVVAQA